MGHFFIPRRTLALLALTLLMGQAHAAGVYRCVVDGVPTFTNKAIKGQGCKLMAQAPPPPSQPHIPHASYPTANMAVGSMGSAPGLPEPHSLPGELPPLPPMSLPPDTALPSATGGR